MKLEAEPVEALSYRVGDFEGPLSLLLHLIEKHRLDIYDIPIASLTAQYFAYLPQINAQVRDEEAASFLVMASTLLHIKSRMLLPRPSAQSSEAEDPRTELVLQLLEYKRCKYLAEQLKQRQQVFAQCKTRSPLTADQAGIPCQKLPPPPLDWARFQKACQRLAQRNQIRFQDLRSKVTQVLRQDRLPLKQRIRLVWERVKEKGSLFFFEIIPPEATKPEQVSGFLAVLELLRLNQIRVEQREAFAPMLLSREPEADEDQLNAFLREPPVEEAYV